MSHETKDGSPFDTKQIPLYYILTFCFSSDSILYNIFCFYLEKSFGKNEWGPVYSEVRRLKVVKITLKITRKKVWLKTVNQLVYTYITYCVGLQTLRPTGRLSSAY